MDHHPFRVDIADFQMRRFGAPQTSAVQDHKHDPVHRRGRGRDDARHVLLAENGGQAVRLLRVRHVRGGPWALEHLHVKEAQRGDPNGHGRGRHFANPEQVRLVLADVLQVQLLGRTPEVPGEIRNGEQIRPSCSLGVITTLEFVEHQLS